MKAFVCVSDSNPVMVEIDITVASVDRISEVNMVRTFFVPALEENGKLVLGMVFYSYSVIFRRSK